MIVFATIFGVGFGILALSLIFGSDADTDVDTDVDHGGGPNILSLRMVSLFMVGFGAVGFGFRATTDLTMLQSSLAGLGGAIAVGAVGWVILRAFYSSQASSTITDEQIVGQSANLIDAVGKDQYGQVACIIGGREITFLARSINGEVIAKNSPVKIVSKTGNIVTVTKI